MFFLLTIARLQFFIWFLHLVIKFNKASQNYQNKIFITTMQLELSMRKTCQVWDILKKILKKMDL